ncbi:MAG TPA: histidine phosphatase family protein [Caulobacteraceae bacterium]
MRRIFIIRHGRPTAVWGGGDADPGLDPTGTRQSVEAAVALLSLPSDQRPRAVASSPLRRCTETALPLAQALGVDIEIVPEVGEIPTPRHLAPAERGSWLRSAMAGTWSDIKGDIDYDAWRADIAEAVRARPGTAVFSHFVAINALVSLLEGSKTVVSFRPDHAAITTLKLDRAGLELVSIGAEAVTGVL